MLQFNTLTIGFVLIFLLCGAETQMDGSWHSGKRKLNKSMGLEQSISTEKQSRTNRLANTLQPTLSA